jgi:hypothetical protein
VTDPLEDLTAAGVSIWLDDLSRKLLTAGALKRLERLPGRSASVLTRSPAGRQRPPPAADCQAWAMSTRNVDRPIPC